MKKELTLMEKLILSEMAGAKYGRGRRLIREAGNDPMGGAGGDDPMGGSDPMGGAGDMGGSDPMGGGADPMGGGADPMGGADAMGGGAADMGGGADPMGGGAGDMGGGLGDMGGGAGPMGGAGDSPLGGLGDGPLGGPDGGDEDEDDDTETLNIDDLTNAQEKMNNKINTIGRNQITTDKSIESLLGSFQTLISKIDSQNAEIQRLQQDIIKRNPTPTENLYIQSLDSYPYNTNIADYWKGYIENGKGNYNVVAGGMGSRADGGQNIDGSNAQPEETVYEITTDDLDNMGPDDTYRSFSMRNSQEEDHNLFRPRF